MSRSRQSAPRPRRRTLLAGTVAALVLAACAPIAPREAAGAAPRALMPAFLLDGRMSATDGRQAASGRVEWEHATHTDRLTLLSPLGQIVARLDSGPDGARLFDRPLPYRGGPQQLFQRADQALYLAKRRGRDRVEVADD